MKRLRKGRPIGIALHIKLSLPTSDCRVWRVTVFVVGEMIYDSCWRRGLIFSPGILISPFCVSMVRPRYVMQVVGDTVFLGRHWYPEVAKVGKGNAQQGIAQL